ncbi:MAG: polyketide synthase dehydratase domain-containing protein, partial [Verrucomicrobiota bacterium]
MNSQIELERDIYERFRIHPESISYVETHGTGTKLGDPIELEALATVFQEKTDRKNYCALGSVKSNLGHTSAAAGVAGMHKVLLSFRHRQLVPSLHFETGNRHFNFDDSPFFVNTELRPWDTRAGQPRRAVISSFGFSGTNAHVVVEEYAGQPTVTELDGPVMIALSARTPERLREVIDRLCEFLKRNASSVDLNAVAYTLHVGRDAMEQRLGLMVSTVEELIEKLELWLIGGYEGGEMADQRLNDWVNGADVDWNEVYAGARPRRIELPTYPFARESYWVGPARTFVRQPSRRHPLVHENTSTLSQARFSSRFDGSEFFFTDHRVHGRSILPGVAGLEMARAAVEQATGDGTVTRLEHIVWLRPIDSSCGEVHVRLMSDEGGRFRFEIFSEYAVHSEGAALDRPLEPPATIDLEALRASCTPSHVEVETCYAAFQESGLDYGPGFLGMAELHLGENEVLARLELPDAVRSGWEEYVLHPSLLDSALQSAIGLALGTTEAGEGTLFLPFGLDALEIFGPCPSNPWVWLRVAEQEKKLRKLDIDLFDETGQICLRMRGFSARVLEDEQATVYRPVWKEEEPADVASEIDQRVALCGSGLGLSEMPHAQWPCVGSDVADDVLAGAQKAFEEIRGRL